MDLRTERLRIRELGAGDAAFIVQLLNEPSFIQNIGDRGVRTIADAVDYIDAGPRASYARHGFGLCLVEILASGTPAGICGLLKRDELPDPDLGFAFLPAYWSQGFAFESASGVTTFARDSLKIPRLLAIVNPSNAPSIRLLGKLGFSFERMIRIRPDGQEIELRALAF